MLPPQSRFLFDLAYYCQMSWSIPTWKLDEKFSLRYFEKYVFRLKKKLADCYIYYLMPKKFRLNFKSAINEKNPGAQIHAFNKWGIQ